jgi:hypothetical protein
MHYIEVVSQVGGESDTELRGFMNNNLLWYCAK